MHTQLIANRPGRRTILYYIILSLVLITSACNSKKSSQQSDSDELDGTISLSGAFALYPLANRWAEEFRNLHPEVRFNISAGGAGKGMADALARAVDLGMLSREIKDEELTSGAWAVAVTKDAVIATINSSNPAFAAIQEKGLSREDLSRIFVSGKVTTWGEVTGTSASEKITIYTRSDASGAAATWAQYLGEKEQDALKGIGVFGDPGLADAVKKDISGIGFNNVIYVYDLTSRIRYPGIEVAPIDLNGDNVLSQEERFYDNLDQLMAAIADGRYPSPPARELYFVSKGEPESKLVKTFLRWVLTEGQQFVGETGYIPLPAEKVQSELSKLK